jgi:hypothetical protein
MSDIHALIRRMRHRDAGGLLRKMSDAEQLEAAGLLEAAQSSVQRQISYPVLQDFALANRVSYNELCAAVQKSVEPTPSNSDQEPLVKPVLAHLEAYAVSEYGDGPNVASINVDSVFVATLRDLRQFAVDKDLSEVRKSLYPQSWGPAGVEKELRLNQGELVVTPHSFWFQANPHGQDYHVETRAADLDEFLLAVQRHTGDGPMYFGEQAQEIQRLVESDNEDEADLWPASEAA